MVGIQKQSLGGHSLGRCMMNALSRSSRPCAYGPASENGKSESRERLLSNEASLLGGGIGPRVRSCWCSACSASSGSITAFSSDSESSLRGDVASGVDGGAGGVVSGDSDSSRTVERKEWPPSLLIDS